MKKNISIVTALIVLLCSLTNTPVYAKECTHEYTNDVCEKCGEYILHNFENSICFYTIKNDVPIWEKPTKYSERIDTIKNERTLLYIDGLLRNQYGNIWLHVSSGGFVYSENTFLIFEALFITSYQKVTALGEKFELLSFYDLVQPGGTGDYKKWLDPSAKHILYNVEIQQNMYQMTAEEIGNIHYGYLGRAIGIDSETLLRAGGIVNIITSKSLLKNIDACINSYCDNENDVINVQRGIDYYDSDVFE